MLMRRPPIQPVASIFKMLLLSRVCFHSGLRLTLQPPAPILITLST
ncbi:hypothetical protein X922_17790 [Pseudomonas aeruginosa VRFPA08]|nr:hypothetical protein X922_17790 [Pseudomonas aeruginosa VRFPA08]